MGAGFFGWPCFLMCWTLVQYATLVDNVSVFLIKLTQLSIPRGGIRLGVDPSGALVPLGDVHVQLGMWVFPIWLNVALQHAVKSKSANKAFLEAHREKHEENKAAFLEEEFVYGMQSIVASATALDAFYASFKDYAKFSDSEMERMRAGRASRPVRIKEALRRVFSLDEEQTAQLHKILSTTYEYRGWAVHPHSGQKDPVYHPDIDAGVEWRIRAFSCSNAIEILRWSISVIYGLIEAHSKADPEDLAQKVCSQTLRHVAPIVAAWEKEFGSLQARVS